MININQFDSISISNFVRFNIIENDYLFGEEGDRMKRQSFVLASGRIIYLIWVFMLEFCDWLKCREQIAWLANDVEESWTVSVSGWSILSGKTLDD